MNLKKINPARSMTWNGKSLTVCSRQELIECIFHLVQQAAIAEQQLKILRLSSVKYSVGGTDGDEKAKEAFGEPEIKTDIKIMEEQKATIRAMAYNEAKKRKNVESVPTKNP
jgi:hypothetical protein